MKIFRRLLLASALLFSISPIAGASSEDHDLETILSKKHVITEDNFDRAMEMVSSRPGGEYLAEKLTSKLRQFVGAELSANEWCIEVQTAYTEVLRSLDRMTAMMMSMSHPKEAIVLATIWAIPNE